MQLKNRALRGFPGGSAVKNLSANAGDTGLIPDPGRSHIPTKSVGHNYWTGVPEPKSQNYRSPCPKGHAPQQETPLQWETCAPQWRTDPAHHKRKSEQSNEEPVPPNINNFFKQILILMLRATGFQGRILIRRISPIGFHWSFLLECNQWEGQLEICHHGPDLD